MTLNTSGPRQAPHDLLGPDANAAVAAPEGRVDIVRMAAWLVVGTVIIGLLYYGQEVLIPLAIAFLISFALGPLVKVLVRRGIPQAAAVSVVMLTVIAMLLGLGLLITSQVSVLSAELPAYQSTIRMKIAELGQQMRSHHPHARARDMILSGQRAAQDHAAADQRQRHLVGHLAQRAKGLDGGVVAVACGLDGCLLVGLFQRARITGAGGADRGVHGKNFRRFGHGPSSGRSQRNGARPARFRQHKMRAHPRMPGRRASARDDGTGNPVPC